MSRVKRQNTFNLHVVLISGSQTSSCELRAAAFIFFPKKSSLDPLQPIFHLSTTTKAVLVISFPGQSSGLIV